MRDREGEGGILPMKGDPALEGEPDLIEFFRPKKFRKDAVEGDGIIPTDPTPELPEREPEGEEGMGWS